MFSIFTPLRARPRATISKISVIVSPLPRAAMTSSCSASERCGAMEMSADLPELPALIHNQSSCQQLPGNKHRHAEHSSAQTVTHGNMSLNVYRADSVGSPLEINPVNVVRRTLDRTDIYTRVTCLPVYIEQTRFR